MLCTRPAWPVQYHYMNNITKIPLGQLGYNFIKKEFLPKGKDEYYIRNEQNGTHKKYRALSSVEIKQLIANGNTSDNWANVLVSQIFDPALIQQCKFYGLVRIGDLENCFLEFHDMRLLVGLYNSTIISSDLGDNIVVNNVNYLSHYIIGNEVILFNINEIEVSDHAKFGNGIIKEGEKESVRIWLELCNENAGRSILPFDGMQTGDAWLWTRHRTNEVLMEKFLRFTERKFDLRRGSYGMIGERTVIKNSRILKDVFIGPHAYIKGANKLKNLTINSSAESPTQIGEGCEMVNGIIGFGCKAFYGIKAVRFILASHSQLKYGARLINSFLGDNSTISCCEVLNSLIFPAHEQHHNNSFLCASLLMGQSNMAAGATIGSNHNSRGADGELIAGRGFWPGLCVSLKHNSRFASYTLLAKGDFPAELDIQIPFSLVSNDIPNDRLVIMPGYWFMYNMYALARNSGKYESRDKRQLKNQYLEYDFLAPDSVNEIFNALDIFKQACAEASHAKNKKRLKKEESIRLGGKLLEQGKDFSKKEILLQGAENSDRHVKLIKVNESYSFFKDMIVLYGVTHLIKLFQQEKSTSTGEIINKLSGSTRGQWINVGGQLMPRSEMNELILQIESGKINSWDEVHTYYHDASARYLEQKMEHAFASLIEIKNIKKQGLTEKVLTSFLDEALAIKKNIVASIFQSRAKDYQNPFRQMVYETEAELEKVIGSLKDNAFIRQQNEELEQFEADVKSIKIRLAVKTGRRKE